MTIRLKIITLALLWVIFAALLIYLAGLIADRVNEVSRAGSQSIYVRTITYGEVER